MYPNYTKAFLNLEGVSIKKVVQADSFIKIFIQSQPAEQTCHAVGLKQNGFMITVCKRSRTFPYRENK